MSRDSQGFVLGLLSSLQKGLVMNIDIALYATPAIIGLGIWNWTMQRKLAELEGSINATDKIIQIEKRAVIELLDAEIKDLKRELETRISSENAEPQAPVNTRKTHSKTNVDWTNEKETKEYYSSINKQYYRDNRDVILSKQKVKRLIKKKGKNA